MLQLRAVLVREIWCERVPPRQRRRPETWPQHLCVRGARRRLGGARASERARGGGERRRGHVRGSSRLQGWGASGRARPGAPQRRPARAAAHGREGARARQRARVRAGAYSRMAMARAQSFSKSFYVSPPSSAPPRLKPVSVQPNGAAEDDGEQIRIKQLELSASTHEELFDSLESDEELSRSRVDWDQLVFKKFLGCGQFGDVCAMEFTPSDGGRPRPVAVKSLRPVRGSIGDLNDMRREIRLLSELSSKCANIVEFVGWGVVQGSGSDLGDGKGDRSLFLVEELCTEGSLSNKVVAQSVGTGSYSASDALAWTLDIARALDALHTQAQPIIHRDLKLGNVVLRASDVLGARPTAVLCDFGIAKPLPILPHEGSVRPRPGQLTRRNTMYQMTGNVGSCAYCAPEIVEGKQ